MENRGLYVAIDERDAIGISLAVVFDTERKDFQIAFMFGCYMLAIGYQF